MKKLSNANPLSQLAISKGLNTWVELSSYIENLPYGRNENRSDFALVLKEERGTCSSKHALLKSIAMENGLSEVRLILGIYKMNERNTIGIDSVLNSANLEYIPEAHCYLKIGDEYSDFTSPQANITLVRQDILLEQEISPEQVVEFKVLFHREYLKKWIEQEGIPCSFEELWSIRERCIAALS